MKNARRMPAQPSRGQLGPAMTGTWTRYRSEEVKGVILLPRCQPGGPDRLNGSLPPRSFATDCRSGSPVSAALT
jgi:hypothetical protein